MSIYLLQNCKFLERWGEAISLKDTQTWVTLQFVKTFLLLCYFMQIKVTKMTRKLLHSKGFPIATKFHETLEVSFE